MANKRLPVRKIKEVLRLKYVCGLSEREIARGCLAAPWSEPTGMPQLSKSGHHILHYPYILLGMLLFDFTHLREAPTKVYKSLSGRLSGQAIL